MRKSFRQAIRDLLNPVGPIGEVLSPSEVYKTRAGLPIDAPHTARANLESRPSFIQQTLAPARFIPAAEAQPPKDRVRQVSPYVQERWMPVYAKPQNDSIAEAVRCAQTIIGWTVTQHEYTAHCDCEHATFVVDRGKLIHKDCGRTAKRMGEHAEDFAEHIQTLQLAPQDQYLNGFYPTIPGKDSIMTPRGEAKGGTRITGGRAEYARKTAGMVHWDHGTPAARVQAEKAEAAKREANLRKVAEQNLKAMPHKISGTT